MAIRILDMLLIIVVCAISSISDIKNGIIRNKILCAIGIPAIILNIIWSSKLYIVTPSLIVMSSVVPFFAATLLYGLKIWAGGDYKLFLVILFSMPYDILTSRLKNLPIGIGIIALSFVLGYVFLIIESLLFNFKYKATDRVQMKSSIRKSLCEFGYYIPLYFFINLSQLFLSTLAEQLVADIDIRITFCVNVLIIIFVQKFKILQSKTVVVVIVIVNAVLHYMGVMNIFSKSMVVLWALVLFTYLLRNFVSRFNYHEITADELKAGMILSFETSYIFTNAPKCKYNKISKENLESRITEKEAIAIKEFCIRFRNEVKLKIVKKVPFGFFISISTVVLCMWERICL